MPETLPVIESLDKLSFANGQPSLKAIFKQEFSDFQVHEELGFPLTGAGEHLCIHVKKVDMSTADVAQRLSEITGVRMSSIGYSGMKDRRSESTQWFSLQLGKEEEHLLAKIENDRLRILDSSRNSRKIRIGSHKANRFQIRLRHCHGAQTEFDHRLETIKREGVANYFGPQRFGRQMGNMSQVLELMRRELAKADDSGSQIARKGKRLKRGILYSAARSYLFNQLLSRRLQEGSWNQYIAGDVLNLNGTSRCFLPDAEKAWDAELQQRLEQFDIHITGALPGLVNSKDKYVSSGKAADIEDAVCKQSSMLFEGLKLFGVKASRRPLRFVAANLAWQWSPLDKSTETNAEAAELGKEEKPGQDLVLNFTLPTGTYATSLLRELCGLG